MTVQLAIFIFLMGFTFSAPAQNPKQDAARNSVPDPFPATADQPATQPGASKPGLTPPGSVAPASTQPAAANAPNLLSPLSEQKNTGTFKRDPFRLPKYLIDKLTYKPAPVVVVDDQAIDDKAEPIRRWPAKDYLLVGIIWEVKNPKGLVKDLQGRVHVVKLRDRLGNKEGIITSIREGAITITEKKVPFVLRLKK